MAELKNLLKKKLRSIASWGLPRLWRDIKDRESPLANSLARELLDADWAAFSPRQLEYIERVLSAALAAIMEFELSRSYVRRAWTPLAAHTKLWLSHERKCKDARDRGDGTALLGTLAEP